MYVTDFAPPLMNARRTDEGYLVADVRVARTGVQEYLGKEVGRPELDIVRVYRPPEEVFSKDAMASYAHRPVTVDHPTEMVSSDSWKSLGVGHTGEQVVRDGEFVRVSMMVMDEKAIKEIENGKRQLSMGYGMKLKWEAGTTEDGQSYDAIHTNLRMNHVAIVDQARGGSQLVIDSKKGEREMPDLIKMTVDGVPIEVSDTAKAVIEKLQGAITAKDASLKELQTQLETKDGEVTALQQKVADAAMTPEKLSKLVRDRKAVVDAFDAIVGKDGGDTDDMSEMDMKKKAVKAKVGEAADSMSDDAISGAFSVLAADAQKANDQSTKANDPFRQVMSDKLVTANDADSSWDAAMDAAGTRKKKEA